MPGVLYVGCYFPADYHHTRRLGSGREGVEEGEGAESQYNLGEDSEILPLLRSQKMLIDRDCLDLKNVIGQGESRYR